MKIVCMCVCMNVLGGMCECGGSWGGSCSQKTLLEEMVLWKSHSFDYTDLCQESNVCFLIRRLGL